MIQLVYIVEVELRLVWGFDNTKSMIGCHSEAHIQLVQTKKSPNGNMSEENLTTLVILLLSSINFMSSFILGRLSL